MKTINNYPSFHTLQIFSILYFQATFHGLICHFTRLARLPFADFFVLGRWVLLSCHCFSRFFFIFASQTNPPPHLRLKREKNGCFWFKEPLCPFCKILPLIMRYKEHRGIKWDEIRLQSTLSCVKQRVANWDAVNALFIECILWDLPPPSATETSFYLQWDLTWLRCISL